MPSAGGAGVADAGPDGDERGAVGDDDRRPGQLSPDLHPRPAPGRDRTDLRLHLLSEG